MADGRRARTPGRAELATLRLFTVGAAIVALLVAAVATLVALREADLTLPPWFVVLAAVATAAFLATGMLAPWLTYRALRLGAGFSAASYFVVLAAFGPAARVAHELERIPWMLTAAGAAVVAALVAGGVGAAWLALAAATVGTTAARLAAGGLDEHGLANDAQMLLTGAVICVVCGHLLDVARQLDEAASTAAAAARIAASERGRVAARTRAAALVHDEVLATLNLARSALPVPAARLADQAGRAADLVASLADDDAAPRPLAAAIAAAAAAAGARYRHADAGLPSMEPAVRDALVAATRQALENSIRHAGVGSVRSVTLTTDDRGVTIEVIDDGAGFDPAAVPEDRLGVRTSIRGRMSDVGGSAVVAARRSGGTRVELRWSPPDRHEFAQAEPSRQLRLGLVVVAVVFVAGQTLSAVLAARASPAWWVPMLVLAAVLAGAEVLRRSPHATPSLARTVVLVALIVGTTAVAVPAVPFTFGTLWFVAAAAFLLVALALRSRPWSAVTGLAALVVVIGAGGVSAGAPAITIVQAATRPVVVVGLAVALLLVVERMQRRTRALHAAAIDTARRRAWDEAARAESAVRAAALNAQVVPLLRRIAAGGVDDATRRECAALEGELRDEYRAGALAREPLRGATRAARQRGVDVVLLDDSDGHPDEAQAEEISRWMASAVAAARTRVVGRLLPAGRAAIATVTVDGRTTDFGGPGVARAEEARLT